MEVSEDQNEEQRDDVVSEREIRKSSLKVSKLPVFSIPTWLKKFFDYDGHIEGKSGNLVMTCKLCRAENELRSLNKKVQYYGSGTYNFARHAQVRFVNVCPFQHRIFIGEIKQLIKNLFPFKLCHPDEYNEEAAEIPDLSKKKLPKTNVGAKSVIDAWSSNSWKPLNNNSAYMKDHPVQRRFMRDLMDCISVDQLPLSFIERATFQKLVRNLNREVRLVLRRSIGRRYHKFHYTEVTVLFTFCV